MFERQLADQCKKYQISTKLHGTSKARPKDSSLNFQPVFTGSPVYITREIETRKIYS